MDIKVYPVLLLCLVQAAACRKEADTPASMDPAPDSTQSKPIVATPKSPLKIKTEYYGQSYDYSDCHTLKHYYYPDAVLVTEIPADSTISFSGSRSLNGYFTFKKDAGGKYTLPLYTFTIKGDSLYASYHRTYGMCMEYYNFGGKK